MPEQEADKVRKITMKIEEPVVTELKKLVAPKKTYSDTIKMLIDHYKTSTSVARGPSPSKYRE